MDTVRTFFQRDWGEVLAITIPALVFVMLITSPRETVVIISLTHDGFFSYRSPWYAAFFTVPAGIIAKDWKIAGFLTAVGIISAFLAEVDVPSSGSDRGLAIIGITLFLIFTAGITRFAYDRSGFSFMKLWKGD